MNNAKSRITYIDILRGLAIILVVIGHIPYTFFNADVHKIIYSFHMPLFFFVSGLTMALSDYKKTTLGPLLKKRFCRVYLPFLLWAVLLALPSITLQTIPQILYGTHESIREVSLSSLWFLPVLFLSTVALDCVLYRLKNKTKLLYFVVPLLLLLTFAIHRCTFFTNNDVIFGLDIVPMALLFILLGYLFQKNKDSLSLKVPSIVLLLFVLCFGFAVYYFGMHNGVSYVLMAEGRYGNIILFLLSAMCGIACCLLISILIDRHFGFISKILQKVGRNTFVLFVLQRYTLALTDQLFLLNDSVVFSNWVVIPVYTALTLLVCVPISEYIKRYLPPLAGIFPPKA